MLREVVKRFQFSKLLDATSMKNKELRTTRLSDCAIGVLYCKTIPLCLGAGLASWAGSYALGIGLAIGAAGSDGDRDKQLSNIMFVHNVVKWGGLLSFGSLAVFCGVRGFRHFSRGYKCHKELIARVDKVSDI
jgi:hypothetical protein